MESISSRELAQSLLDSYLRDETPSEAYLDELLRRALSDDSEIATFGSRALFSILVEGLSDRFEPRLCDAYAELFSRVAALSLGLDGVALYARYRALPHVKLRGEPKRVFVLSRVTLGADIAITSVLLDAAKQRFPQARIVLVGPRKAYQLFEKDDRIEHQAVEYTRGGLLRERLGAGVALRALLDDPDALILDPDSRLSQLGMLPAGRTDNYLWFPSRSYGAATNDSLTDLAARWAQERLDVAEAVPFLAPKFQFDFGGQRVASVSFGVGENPAKRVDDDFERDALKRLASRFDAVIVDRGAGGEEAARVERAIAESGCEIGVHDGSFASFAALIAATKFYLGYDSAGQHAASATCVPLTVVFKGFVSDRMAHRWSPSGPGPHHVIRVTQEPGAEVLRRMDETGA